MVSENQARAKWLKKEIKGTKATIVVEEADKSKQAAKKSDHESKRFKKARGVKVPVSVGRSSSGSRSAPSFRIAEERTMPEAPLDYISLKNAMHKDPFRVGSTIFSKDSRRAETKGKMAASSSTKEVLYRMNEDDIGAEITKSASLIDHKTGGADRAGLKDNRNLSQVDNEPSVNVSGTAPAAVFTYGDNPDGVKTGKAGGRGRNGKHNNTLEGSEEVNGGDDHGTALLETPSAATHKEAEANHIVPENLQSTAHKCARDDNGKHG
ncbi:hypothetical protein AC579_3886 [Pseudocercospora musae]|uniref:Uncharacterized protein n=1 Tax=Pseudocercospora musae TaxID=113226 RepID=A0A139IRG9_9PEZI|nr:hypothetical protein AC579_3886 [Pseudocercospora musae]